MVLKSNFREDFKKEKKLQLLLDAYYSQHLRHYAFKRIDEISQQLAGVDLVLSHLKTNENYKVDEKAQLDYIGDNLPTFAFEISYYKSGHLKKGWLFDENKKTQFYSLVTAIYQDEPEVFTSCRITLVNREKLIDFLEAKNVTFESCFKENLPHGKTIIEQLHPKKEGYLYYSHLNKAEKPLNLILKLDFLIEEGLAKRLV